MSRNARTVTISNNNVEFNVTHVRLSVRARSSRSIAFFIAYLYRESGQRVERWRTRRRSNDTKQTEKRVTFAFSHDSSDTYRSIGTCSSDDSRILPERFPTKLARATVFAVKETSITEQPRPSNQYIVAVCKCENENHATTSREACANKHEKGRAAFDENTERETERERERERKRGRFDTRRRLSSRLLASRTFHLESRFHFPVLVVVHGTFLSLTRCLPASSCRFESTDVDKGKRERKGYVPVARVTRS